MLIKFHNQHYHMHKWWKWRSSIYSIPLLIPGDTGSIVPVSKKWKQSIIVLQMASTHNVHVTCKHSSQVAWNTATVTMILVCAMRYILIHLLWSFPKTHLLSVCSASNYRLITQATNNSKLLWHGYRWGFFHANYWASLSSMLKCSLMWVPHTSWAHFVQKIEYDNISIFDSLNLFDYLVDSVAYVCNV